MIRAIKRWLLAALKDAETIEITSLQDRLSEMKVIAGLFKDEAVALRAENDLLRELISPSNRRRWCVWAYTR